MYKAGLTLVSPAGFRGRLSIFIFHRVLLEPDPLSPDEPCIRRFDEMMGWVAKWFNVLPLDQAINLLRRGQLPARAAAITFDDGYADNLLHATPILKSHGLHATFFIATSFLDGGCMWNDTIIESIRNANIHQLDANFLGLGDLSLLTIAEMRMAIECLLKAVKHRPISERTEAVEYIREACGGDVPDNLMLTSMQVRELHQSGMAIGAHTVTHPILVHHPDAAARQEIADSRDCLEGLLGVRINLFAYPNGKFGRDYITTHASMVRELGFSAAVSTNWGTCGPGSDMFQLPRFTPWDRNKWSFGARCIKNLWQVNAATGG